MEKFDSFEISDSKCSIYSTTDQEKDLSDDPTKKITKLSNECLNEQNFLIKTSKQNMTLQIKKSTRHSLDFNISFWNELKKMPENTIKEQFHDLLLLCDLKTKATQKSLFTILTFGFNLVKSQENMGLSKLRSIIGKLIYLVNVNSDEICEGLKHKNEEKKIQLIENCFDIELSNIASFLLKFKADHKRGLLQDEHKALSVRIPIELAKALISDSGHVNVGIIDALMSRFLSPKKNLPFEKNIVFALNSIKRSSLLRQKIFFITEPYSQILPANDLIRITLGLPADTITTSIHAKKTALTALISHMRQSPASSCFASYLAIELLSTQLIKCLNDFCELLQKNNLSRIVNGGPKEFYFLMRTGKESTSQVIELDISGKIYSTNGLVCYSWEVPGLKAACSWLGFIDVKKTMQELSIEINNARVSEKTAISISRILKMIAKKALGDPLYNFSCAKLSFESQLHNPLLRVWENVMASMAEATEYGKITEALINSVTMSLDKLFGTNLILKRQIKRRVRDLLMKSVHFAYDTDIKNSKLASDGRSGRGAFVLYNKCGSSKHSDWKLIENAEDFRFFVSLIVHQSFTTIQNKEVLLSEIKKYIFTDNFLTDSLRFYDVSNTYYSDKELTQNIKELPHTPWKDRTGNNSTEVLRIYYDSTLPPIPFILDPRNATKLLLSLIDIGRKFPERLKQTLNEKPHTLTPLIIKNVHAFSMTFGSESFMRVLNSKKPADEWIRDNIINPGLEISNSKISDEAKKTLILFALHHAIPKNDKAGMDKFHEKINSINGDFTLTAFRNQLVSIIKEISNETYRPLKTVTQGIDFYIYKYAISAESQAKLQSANVQFADSNWDAKLHDVHFCFFFNPGSAKLEMWEVYEDGTGLYPLNQQDWITDKTWEIYQP